MPNWLTGDAKVVWAEVVPPLAKLGLATQLDVGPLSRYCYWWARWHDCRRVVTSEGLTVAGSTGSPVQHPALRALSQINDILLKHEGDFGLSPNSRRTLAVSAAAGATDDLQALLALDPE